MAETETVTAPVTMTTTPVSIIPDITVKETVPSDLTAKIAQFKQNKPAPTVMDNQSFFDYKEIEKITDPTARKFADDAYKSMQSGFTKKTQEIADNKRFYEQKMQEMQNWSPERIQKELLNNPQFLQAAQQIQANQNPPNSGLTDQQFSALTPEEQATIGTLKNEINSLKQVNYQAIVAQRDSQLQTRYPDYNPIQIDETIRLLANTNPLDIREHVYKSIKHDEDVAAAYELGRKETAELNQNKINAITPNGSMTATSDGLPIRDPKQNDREWFQTIANFRLAQFKNRKAS